MDPNDVKRRVFGVHFHRHSVFSVAGANQRGGHSSHCHLGPSSAGADEGKIARNCLYLWVNTLWIHYSKLKMTYWYIFHTKASEGISKKGKSETTVTMHSGLMLATHLSNHIWKSIGIPQFCQSASEQAELAQIIQWLGWQRTNKKPWTFSPTKN